MARKRIRRRGDKRAARADTAAARSALARLGWKPVAPDARALLRDSAALEQLAATPDPWPLEATGMIIKKKSRVRCAP